MLPRETDETPPAPRQVTLSTGHRAHVAVRADAGSRPRCLLLHGNPGSMEDWRYIFGPLGEVVDVAAVDLPGFGRSPRPEAGRAEMGLDHLADDAVGIADVLGWSDPFYIVGHSHGGGVAQRAASRHPDRIAGIVLVATLGAPAHWSYRLLALPGAGWLASALGRALGVPWGRPFVRRIVGHSMTSIFHPEAVLPDQVDGQLSSLAARPGILRSMVDVACGGPSGQLLQSASTIRCPALFVHGDSDRLVHQRYAESIHRRIVAAGGTSELRVIDGAGHMVPMFQASDLVDEIRAFVARNPPNAGVP